MRLDEILNRAAKLEVVSDTEKKYAAKAEINGRHLEFRMEKWPGMSASWNFLFVEKAKDDDDESHEWDEDGETFDATGRGNEFEVFATAKAFLENAIAKLKPKAIYFEADKANGPSRAKLYSRFTKRWHPAGYYHEMHADKNFDYHSYVLSKTRLSKPEEHK